MQLISVDELINYKILPFDLYAGKGKKIFSAGEVLTPGKILQLKYIPAIYIEEMEKIEENEDFIDADDEDLKILDSLASIAEEGEVRDEENELTGEKPRYLGDYFQPNVLEKARSEIKGKYKNMMDSFYEEGVKDPSLCIDIRDSIIEEIIPEVSRVLYKSQLKVYGDFNYSHGLNVALFSSFLAHKMNFNDQAIRDITLAAMLHDIGKTEIPDKILNKTTYTPSELRLMQLHTKLGYNIIKNDLELSENIAKVALQHHERPDGSGYPYGLSDKLISAESHIVTLCDEFDKLTSGKGEIKVRNYKEAIKYLLETGSKHFKIDILYTFVYMTNYNDTEPIIIDTFK